MSNAVTNQVRALRMSPTQKAVLLCLADRADDDGLSWLSLAGMGEHTCLSRTAIIEALRALEALQLIDVERTTGRKSRVRILLPVVHNPCGSRTGAVESPVRQTDGTRTAGAPVPVRQTDGTRTAGAPDTSRTSLKHQGRPRARRAAGTGQHLMPDDFGISSDVREWALQKGYTALGSRLEYFRGWARASGRMYADWDEAFKLSIQGNWAKVSAAEGRLSPPSAARDPVLVRLDAEAARACPAPESVRRLVRELRGGTHAAR